MNELTIKERIEKYELATDPIARFVDNAIATDSEVTDVVLKQMLYAAYCSFCKEKNWR